MNQNNKKSLVSIPIAPDMLEFSNKKEKMEMRNKEEKKEKKVKITLHLRVES